MNKRTTIYSYADSWSNELHSKNLYKTVRRSYFIKGILLLLALPLDLIYLTIVFSFKKQCSVLFATDKWPVFAEAVSERTCTASISSPALLFKKSRSKIRYIPASIFYLPTAIGLFLPKALREMWSKIAVFLLKKILTRFINGTGTVVVHSDALPFGRGLVMAANETKIKSVCIQHGSFREYNIIGEQDGFLCSHNIVRSAEDGSIVAKSNCQTVIHVLPDFFKIRCIQSQEKSIFPTVLLLGEGYHIVDSCFNEKYLKNIETIQDELTSQGVNVMFRPHPSERGIMWERRFRKVNRDPLEICLSQVHAVVGYSSTLLQESAEVGIVAFYVDPLRNGHEILGRNGAAINKFFNAEKLIQCVNDNYKPDQRMNRMVDRPDIYEDAMKIVAG